MGLAGAWVGAGDVRSGRPVGSETRAERGHRARGVVRGGRHSCLPGRQECLPPLYRNVCPRLPNPVRSKFSIRSKTTSRHGAGTRASGDGAPSYNCLVMFPAAMRAVTANPKVSRGVSRERGEGRDGRSLAAWTAGSRDASGRAVSPSPRSQGKIDGQPSGEDAIMVIGRAFLVLSSDGTLGGADSIRRPKRSRWAVVREDSVVREVSGSVLRGP
jgi:hypothetical protein